MNPEVESTAERHEAAEKGEKTVKTALEWVTEAQLFYRYNKH